MKISVCMATYNGEVYIQQQLESILQQLTANDEVIISDDGSTDSTLKIIQEYKKRYSRIYLNKNPKNKSLIKNFENAIQQSSGDIIFLSDQDDIWTHDKVRKIMDIFINNPQISLIITDASIIDNNGQCVADSFFKLRGKFSSGVVKNILKNKYHGCVMAFKKEILQYCLPFPNKIPMHDMWIGIVNDIYGKTYYLDEPLVKYRRHEKNVTTGKSSAVYKMIKWRLNLIIALLFLVIKKKIS